MSLISSWLDDYIDSNHCRLQRNISGRKLTTIAVGGDIKVLVEPESLEELQQSLVFFFERDLSYRVIGAGSNILLPDQGVQIPVIRLGRFFRYYQELGNDRFEVGASMPVMVLSRELSKLGYSGLEFAGGIPATLGGAVRMNAGAHGAEFAQIIHAVNYFDRAGQYFSIPCSDIQFEYRRNSLPQDAIIVSVELQLNSGAAEQIMQRQQEHLEYRKLTQPLTLPSAGSIFKNPLPEYAGALIEKAGLKGVEIGAAQISKLHANWIVNPQKNASAEDVKALISLSQARVWELFKIHIEPELQIW